MPTGVDYQCLVPWRLGRSEESLRQIREDRLMQLRADDGQLGSYSGSGKKPQVAGAMLTIPKSSLRDNFRVADKPARILLGYQKVLR